MRRFLLLLLQVMLLGAVPELLAQEQQVGLVGGRRRRHQIDATWRLRRHLIGRNMLALFFSFAGPQAPG